MQCAGILISICCSLDDEHFCRVEINAPSITHLCSYRTGLFRVEMTRVILRKGDTHLRLYA